MYTRNLPTAARALLGLALALLAGSCGHRQVAEKTILPADVELREGDVVLRRGGGLTSHAVLAAEGGGAYSHVGIVADSCGTLVVVHAVPGEASREGEPDRVKADRPAQFFSNLRASRGSVWRHPDAQKARGAARQAMNYYARRLLFDHDYDDLDTTRLYCCELVEHAYNAVGATLVGSRRHNFALPAASYRHLILPSDFTKGHRLRHVRSF